MTARYAKQQNILYPIKFTKPKCFAEMMVDFIAAEIDKGNIKIPQDKKVEVIIGVFDDPEPLDPRTA